MFGFFRRRQPTMRKLGIPSLASLCSHFLALGSSGSGKTSVIKLLMQDVFDLGASCVWGCAKSDEAQNAIDVISKSKMKQHLLHLVPGKFRFNFLAYELQRRGGSPATAARLLQRLNDQLRRTTGGSSESFWENFFADFLHFSIVIAWLANREKVTLEHIYQLINSAPPSVEQAKSPAFLSSDCYVMMRQAENNVKNSGEKRLLKLAVEFFLAKQLSMGSKARSAAVTQCCAILTPFLLSPFYETVCCEKSTFTPDMPLQGWCAVLDFPILVYQQGGMLFQSLIIQMVMEAALRRDNPEQVTVLVRDEIQTLIGDPAFEAMVQAVARSHGLAFVSATQNLPLLQTSMGNEANAEQNMLAFVANYNTKLALSNTCAETLSYFCDSMGNHREQFISINESQRKEDLDFWSCVFGAERFTFSTSEQLVPRLTPDQFLSLRRGGKSNGYLVEGFLSQGGRVFSNGFPFDLVSFSQR